MKSGIEKAFSVSPGDLKKIMRSFHREMDSGLAGGKSSLKMIPTYASKPTGDEKGRFIALDLGGTNCRILEVELKGKGRYSILGVTRCSLGREDITGTGNALFDFIAGCVRGFLDIEGLSSGEKRDLGFTFSFPVEQTGIAAGKLLKWTKGFSASGVEGRDVVKLLDDALRRQGLGNIKVAALMNDTVGTLVSKSYEDPSCDAGVIIGTGTNACYEEDIANITKWRGPAAPGGRMIINIEWGNFDKLLQNAYDKKLDSASGNPGHHILEKMVSGLYLGELARLVLGGRAFKAEDMSRIESDNSPSLARVGRVAKGLGLEASALKERRFIKDVCVLISLRAARISAAAVAAVITKIDPHLLRNHTVAIDGSVYEKHPRFAGEMKDALREIFGKDASRIKLVLAKDGSGKGAAILAAVARGSRR